jgi:hypothetical protein
MLTGIYVLLYTNKVFCLCRLCGDRDRIKNTTYKNRKKQLFGTIFYNNKPLEKLASVTVSLKLVLDVNNPYVKSSDLHTTHA